MKRSLRREIHEAVDMILDMLTIAIEDEIEQRKGPRKKAARTTKTKRQQVA